jgi:glutaredoxin|tara:strand:+ start:800 stop:1252 length:453 start_codon:yes stop_codon:yes gene_type:complete
MSKKVIVYTSKTCSFCAQMKKQLIAAEIDYIEKVTTEHAEEWDGVKTMTAVPVFPTLMVGDEYLIPNRDFQNPQQGIQLVKKYMSDTYVKPSTDKLTRELLKTINASVNIVAQRMATLQNKVNSLETTLNNLIVDPTQIEIPKEVTNENS